MHKQLFTSLLIIAMVGCATQTPPAVSEVDMHFGKALSQSVSEQTVHPSTSSDKKDVPGLDGQSAKSVIDRYQKSYETAPSAGTTFTSTTGGSSTSR